MGVCELSRASYLLHGVLSRVEGDLLAGMEYNIHQHVLISV